MHPILTDHPVYRQAVDEVARIKAAQARHRQQVDQAEKDYRAASAEYQRAAVEALREGLPAPQRPTPPEVDVALTQQLAQDTIESSSILREAERQLAPSLLPQMERRALELEETVKEFADTMRGLAREASELRVTVAAHRAAAGLPPLVNQGVVDVAALFALVVHGDRLLAAESPRTANGAEFDPHAPRGSQDATIHSFASLAGRR